MIEAHLNGGPMDDQYITLERPSFHVARRPRLSLQETDPSAHVTIERGSYAMRRDSLGQPVPHSLSNVVEFDWQGWEQRD